MQSRKKAGNVGVAKASGKSGPKVVIIEVGPRGIRSEQLSKLPDCLKPQMADACTQTEEIDETDLHSNEASLQQELDTSAGQDNCT